MKDKWIHNEMDGRDDLIASAKHKVWSAILSILMWSVGFALECLIVWAIINWLGSARSDEWSDFTYPQVVGFMLLVRLMRNGMIKIKLNENNKTK